MKGEVARVERSLGERLDERDLGGIEYDGLIRPLGERGRDPVAGTDRHLPFGGPAPGQDGDPSAGHGVSDLYSSPSSAISAPSRRIPSSISASVG